MRRMLTMGIALAIITVSSLSVDAGYYRRSAQPCPNCGKHHVYYYETAKDKGFFGRLLDLEKRKNAWLKKTFLGR